jgi:hypothetical protein
VGVFALAVPPPGATGPKGAGLIATGQAVRVSVAGRLPTDRRAYVAYRQGAPSGDQDFVDQAYGDFQWIWAAAGQAVRIVDLDGEAVRVELLDGASVGRQGWLQPRHLTP